MEQDLLQVVKSTKYPLDAFAFLQRGLGFAVEKIHGPVESEEPAETAKPAGATQGQTKSPKGSQAPPSAKSQGQKKAKPPATPPPASGNEPSRHISGRQLCFGLRDFAIDQYGLMARSVLRHWRINSTEDFGHIVFAMVDAGLMHKTDEDCIDDFVDVFDFADAFSRRMELKKLDKLEQK